MLDSIICIVQSNGFSEDTIPILFTNKSFYNNHDLWSMIINNKRNFTPLMNATFNNSFERVKFLVDAFANVNMVDASNQCALLYSFCKMKDKFKMYEKCKEKCTECYQNIEDNLKILELLCEHKADLNILTQDLDNPVFLAVRLNYAPAIKLFCKYNFDINHINKENDTVMSLAIKINSPIICYYLWKKGANINSVDFKKHSFLITMIYNYKNPISYEIIEEVLQHNPNINAYDCNNANAMIYACMTSSPELVELLIKYGSDVNYALMAGICNNNMDHVKLLCCKNANIDYNRMIAQAKKLKFNDIHKFLLQKMKG